METQKDLVSINRAAIGVTEHSICSIGPVVCVDVGAEECSKLMLIPELVGKDIVVILMRNEKELCGKNGPGQRK